MKVLILGDDPERIKKFRSKLLEHSIEVIDDTKVCIQPLQKGGWDVLCLDHDLGGKPHVKSGEKSS